MWYGALFLMFLVLTGAELSLVDRASLEELNRLIFLNGKSRVQGNYCNRHNSKTRAEENVDNLHVIHCAWRRLQASVWPLRSGEMYECACVSLLLVCFIFQSKRTQTETHECIGFPSLPLFVTLMRCITLHPPLLAKSFIMAFQLGERTQWFN